MLFTVLFRSWIGKQTAFRTITGGIISRKWVSLTSHALAALLLGPKIVEAWKIPGDNSKGFSPINVPKYTVTVWYGESVWFMFRLL